MTDSTAVVADIGGTNVRIARVQGNRLHDIVSWPCARFTCPEAAIADYLEQRALRQVSLCMAIAGPVSDGDISMTNLDWSFSPQALQHRLRLKKLFVINDYHAMSLAIPALSKDDRVQTGGPQADTDKPALICGPGTGLGVGLLTRGDDGRWLVIPGEGGHMDFAPNSAYETEIWHILHRKYGHVSIERLLSGPGLQELYGSICLLDDIRVETLDAADISRKALSGESDTCHKALQQFCAILGSFCGSMALGTGALGGVYITGGMVPRFLDFFMASEFRARFEAKGRYRSYNEKIPTFVVTACCPGLMGAAAYLRQTLPAAVSGSHEQAIRTRT